METSALPDCAVMISEKGKERGREGNGSVLEGTGVHMHGYILPSPSKGSCKL